MVLPGLAWHSLPPLTQVVLLQTLFPYTTLFRSSYSAHGMLFLSFMASLSPLASSRPIYLFVGPVIHYSCRLSLMGFLLFILSILCGPHYWAFMSAWASTNGAQRKDTSRRKYSALLKFSRFCCEQSAEGSVLSATRFLWRDILHFWKSLLEDTSQRKYSALLKFSRFCCEQSAEGSVLSAMRFLWRDILHF